MSRPPDVICYVFMCLLCPWTVQLGPRARSELGGAIQAYRAVAEAGAEHYASDHPSWRPSDTLDGALCATILPRWWVERG